MNAEQQHIHEVFKWQKLPAGWTCEKARPWQDGTHLIAPQRRGGVVIKDRRVHVQLPGNHRGPCSPKADVGEYRGRGWINRMVEAAVKAAHEHAWRFR